MKVQNLHDLFILELKDLYDAEHQIADALPTMIKNASYPDLKDSLETHLRKTEGHIGRLEEISDNLEIELGGISCQGMEGIINEGKEAIKQSADGDALDAAIIASAQKVEHYEIAGYGTAAAYAREMGHTQAEELLSDTLDEEKDADDSLSSLAESEINLDAEEEEPNDGTGIDEEPDLQV